MRLVVRRFELCGLKRKGIEKGKDVEVLEKTKGVPNSGAGLKFGGR